MKMYKLETANYSETLNDIAQKVNDRLEKYLKESNEENVHNVRTAIRRLELAWKVLPKKIRQKRQVEKFVRSHKKFFKTNSEIRDLDIIQQRLGSFPITTEEIKKFILEKRRRRLLSAQKQANTSHKLKFPKIRQGKISPPKLEKRFRKISVKLIENIHALIPIATSSEKRITELHELRKNSKKLRYLLELVPNSESSSFITKLKEMQDLLGTIHDSDITMNFLKKLPPKYEIAKELLKKESEFRSQLYKKFVEIQKAKQI
jgi:CHAD domain-containing protein